MFSDFQQLIDNRKKWVETNRENGFEEGIKRLLTGLYPYDAHFIYELLQNAEDAKATEVQFIVNGDGVEFRHNGSKLFSMDDVVSITSLGNSNKKDDPTNIGKFGVGFKAVFAYTSTPEIQSGDFHFRILDLVVPDMNRLSQKSLGDKITRFWLPFDNPQKSPAKAYEEVENNLRCLDENTLLFLCNIRKIEYFLPDSSYGYLERIEQQGNRIGICVKEPEDSDAPPPYFYLRFEKMVKVKDEEEEEKNKLKSCRIAVAFFMEAKTQEDSMKTGKKKNVQWEIKPLDHGQVSIYFPAEKETSNLRFHIHAPFASTVARDSVRDCPANNELRDHVADLIVESMTKIRDQGLLTVGFLATLPNPKDNLPPFYIPIQTRLIEAFNTQKLTPMKRGGHAAASKIFRSTAISNLIDDDDLIAFLEDGYSPPLWAANPKQLNQREDNFLLSLDIQKWTTDEFVKKMLSPTKQMKKWLSGKSEEWHQELYAFLEIYLASDKSITYRKNRLAQLSIVRLCNGKYSMGKNCYFPSDGAENNKFLKCVAKGVYSSGKNENQQKKAKKFLVDIGVSDIREADQIEAILKQRYLKETFTLNQNLYFKDMKRFIAFVDNDNGKADLFSDYFLFQSIDGKWCKPNQIFLDVPFYETGLSVYYDELKDETKCMALSNIYGKINITAKEIGDFAMSVGAKTQLEINETTIKPENPQYNDIIGISEENNSSPLIDQDYVIPALHVLLDKPSLNKSKLIWRTMNSMPNDKLKAQFCWNNASPPQCVASQLVHDLRKAKWIPQKNMDSISFVQPCDAKVDFLPEGFSYTTGIEWLEAIEFGTTVKNHVEKYSTYNEVAKEYGFNSADEMKKSAEFIQKLKKEGMTFEDAELKLFPKNDRQNKQFPSSDIPDPERRKRKIEEQITDAPLRQYEKKERSVRVSRDPAKQDVDAYMRDWYTNDDGLMICQICKDVMPFKNRKGLYYYEKVEAFKLEIECEANNIALCPVCAAKYKEFIIRDSNNARENLKKLLLNSETSEIGISLGEESSTIRFVEKHWFDLKTVLESSNSDQDSCSFEGS